MPPESYQVPTNRVTSPGLITRYDGKVLRYIEDKPFDLNSVAPLLEISATANHWTNFGPLSQQIEQTIAERLGLGSELQVVMCSSGTAALHGIISMHESMADKDLRWTTSSFGYYCTIQGPLRNAKVVDCDEHAMLDLNLVAPDECDGIIVTNTFGQADSLEAYYAFAREHNKIICTDSAMAFGSHKHGPNEIISFHHTKPWGFGEGGCAIIEKKHEALFRSLIIFGHRPGQAIDRRASNGKISDIASAFALMRLKHMETLAAEYRYQYERIAKLGRSVGFDILMEKDTHPSIPASVPFLCAEAREHFSHSILPTGRYYYPLADTPKAFEIYKRIINVPCHPGLAQLDDVTLTSALAGLAG